MARLAGKVAIITGAAGGIGAATARLMAADGATVAITDIDTYPGQSLAAEISAEFFPHDVTDKEQWRQNVGAMEAKHGGLHILVNGAGIEGDLVHGGPEEVSLEEWRRIHAINLDGTLLGCQAALPAMRRSGGGSIINISSTAAFAAAPLSAAYGSSKAAVTHLTKTVALHAAKGGSQIRCNSVHPGLILTRMLETIMAERARRTGMGYDAVVAATAKELALGRLGTPEDVAKMIVFLASDEASYVTGGEFRVDGGWRLGAR